MTDTNKKKHQKHDAKRRDLPRLPSSRIKGEDDAKTLEALYALNKGKTKLEAIVIAAREYVNKHKQKRK